MSHRRHPCNTEFAWADHTEEPRFCTRDQLAQFDRDGFFVLEGAFGADVLRPIVEELDAIEAAHRDLLAHAEEGRFFIAETGAITFSPNLVRQSTRLTAFSKHPVFTSLCRDLIGADVNLYWDQAVYKYPEKPRRFPWHQDNGYAFVEPQQYLTCWVALSDATLDTGCPHVAPGLHRLGTLAHTYVDPLGWQIFEEPPSRVTAEVKAGGIVVFSSLTPHLTGPNTTDAVRKAYILQYAPAGAVRLDVLPGKEVTRTPVNDPTYQYPITRDGEAV